MKRNLISMGLALTLLGMSLAGCAGGAAGKDESGKTPDNAAASDKEKAAAAASGGSTAFGGSADESYYMCVFNSGIEYWVPVYAGMKDACKQLGVNCYYMGCTDYDASAQVDVFNQILALNPTGVLLSPITQEAFVSPIADAAGQGVQVVTFASDSSDSKRTSYITSDNTKEGQTAAEAIAKEMGGSGQVMVLRNPGQSNHEIRCNSFIAYLEENYPDIEVVADEASNQNSDTAYSAVMTVAQVYPELKAVFLPEATSAIGAAQAGIELGGGTQSLLICCCDTNEEVLDLLKADQFFSAIAPDQYIQGYASMLNCFMSSHNEFLQPMNNRANEGTNLWQIPYMDNGLSIVTKENADAFYLNNYVKTIGYDSVADCLSSYEVK